MVNLSSIENLKQYKHIHLIGIGGSSMSGIAEILHNWGIFITGSDCKRSKTTDRLSSHGIFISIGHDTSLASKADFIIYSAAVSQDDPELVCARENNIAIVGRADFIGYLTRLFSDTIGIAGTHGKSTTTGMVSLCFMDAGFDPTIQIGAILKPLETNYRLGNSDYFIVEACEYVDSFLKFSPKSSIVLNIDDDHLDYFKNFDNIKAAFAKYVALLPKDGYLIVNADDKNCLDLRNETYARTITFSLENHKANFFATNIVYDKDGFAKFDVYYNNNYFCEMKLSIPGRHNVCNALACIALCTMYGIDKYVIKSSLANFTGVNRRFEFKGSINGINVYDDYAHHPIEINATLQALKCKQYRQSWAIFQARTYHRMKAHLDGFAKSLMGFDNIVITDIYSLREKDNLNVSAADLVKKIRSYGREVIYLDSFDKIGKYIREHACPNDIVITLGSGSVTEVTKAILKE